jgi:glycine oxidase
MGPRVLVVGAGVIGLAVARSLASRGAAVVVLDASPEAREASWAAGGILGVGSESVADGPLFRLPLDAFRSWPGVAADLERETGEKLDFRADGTLLLAFDDAEAAALDARGTFHRAAGLACPLLDGAAARRVEPRISPTTRAALLLPEGRLDNRALWRALLASCRARGVHVRLGCAVTSLVGADSDAAAVAGAHTAEGVERADAVVIAAGAWSRSLANATGLALPTVPVKGHMIRLAAPDGFLSHVVKRGAFYLVPHAGQGLVIGTTAEEMGFDRSLDAAALARIEATAATLVPSITTLSKTEAWAGFRPRLPDLLPAIGPVEGRPGLFVATGHYRNGILLCSITGDLVARAVFGDLDPRLTSFSPARFGKVGSAPVSP